MLKCVIFQDSFVGKEFVDWAVDKKRISREKAIFMGKQLVSRKFGTSADNDQDFRVSRIRGLPCITSAQRGGQKYPKFADKQYIKFGRGV